MPDPTHIRDILKRMPGFSKMDSALELCRLQMEWERVVGVQMARVTRALALKNGILTIGVPGSVWANELHFVKKNIIEAVNILLEADVVEDIRFKVDSELGVSSLIDF